MWAFTIIAERRIEEAMASGKFDRLEMTGIPIDLDDYFNLPAELRMAWTILRNNDCVPIEVSLAREIETLRERASRAASDDERRHVERIIQEKEASLRMMLERRSRTGR